MEALEALARETIDLIVLLQKTGMKNETIKEEISRLKDENLKTFFFATIESLEKKSYIFN